MRILEAGTVEVDLKPEELDALIADLLWWGSADLQTGALVSTVQGGSLSLIENEELRHLIAGFPAEYETMRKLEDQDKETLTGFLFPYLFENASLPRSQIR